MKVNLFIILNLILYTNLYKKDIIYLSQYLTEDIIIEINNYLNNL